MKLQRLVGRAVGFSCLWLAASSAEAVSPRAYVSVNGNDANTCNLPSTPCRTFTGAIAQTTSGGEVVVLDSGTFGGGTISQSVTINAPAGVAALAATQITVNAGASDVVTLRGITFVSPSPGNGTAVMFLGGAVLNVERCVFHGWGTGIYVGFEAQLFVSDSTFRENGQGVGLQAFSGTLRGAFERVEFLGNGVGLQLSGDGAKATVRNSLIAGNFNSGVSVTASNTTTEVDIEDCLIAHNNWGAFTNDSLAGGYGILRIGGSTVTGNVIGVGEFNMSAVFTRGDNTIEGNTTDTFGTFSMFVGK